MKSFKQIVTDFLAPTSKASSAVSTTEWLRGDDVDYPQAKFAMPYAQSAWVYVAVSVLAETLAHIPFRISRGRPKGEELVETGPVVDLFRNPANGINRTLFWQTLVSWEALRGEFFVVPLDEAGRVVRVGRGVQPKQLMTVSPDYMQHITRGNELVGWRCVAPEGGSQMGAQLLLPEEVVHSRSFNPYLYWRGMSPLSVAMMAAESDFAAGQFMKTLMQNNGDAGLIVTSAFEMNESQKAQIYAKLRERSRGGSAVNRPLLLDSSLTVQKPMISSADMQFLDNRRMNREEIGAIYKVPESMMGFGDEKSGLSAGTAMQQDRLNFIENTITGLCRRLESALEPIVKSFDPDLNGWFDVDSLPIMQTARRDRLVAAEKAFGMGVPFNEINELFALGFRPLPWGGKGYVNQNFVELGELQTVSRRVGESVSEKKQFNPELAMARMLQLVEKTQTSNTELRTSNIERNDKEKEQNGKLRHFLLEQCDRALEQLEQEFGFLHVRFQRSEQIEPLLDSERENQFLFERLGLADGLLVEDNEKRLGDIDDAVRKGLESDEDFAEVAERIKRIYHKN
jgi:HK97 family phage portal protein